ncbi:MULTISPECIES: nuclear transport factor 2 family protein [unclassified Amycolatopsis]|uniref:nuclear transport factor 2 family protein n=1 Tax=unclassified Amycolatopsis TaxID=2618356 RepID=UPI00287724D5|nr:MULTISPECIES: nuclear transport factor 2 family protein [unclassified Amycolatopsis]MDS0136320.1 nuclear transport factor 2 family protein [Amycolatopsis sp. 505]MDS0145835.1 nuclear transport factor 2 family protein [Amycolatopsis sp. CM201R]
MDDHRALENLVFGYATLVDAGDFAGVGELFASGTFAGSSGELRGAAEVERMLRETVIVYEDGTPRTKHVTTNLSLEVSGDTATGRAYFTVLQAVPGFPLQTIAAGRYEDRFTRDESGWRFTERRATVDLIGDVSHHLRAKGP